MRVSLSLLLTAICIGCLGISGAQEPIADRNVNMVSGTTLPFGDPFLQRQNEPSLAVSTRNKLVLIAGANDYRTVDLPGLPEDQEIGDAWLGVFKSSDGGQSWRSGLLPGFPQDTSPQGMRSPLKGFQAAADPMVRAGTNGLFFYSGIVFNRGTNAPGAVFVARFIDINNKEGGDTVKYINADLLERGNAGRFIDKPSLAVDIPRQGARISSIRVPLDQDPGETVEQSFACGNVYVSYSVFVGAQDPLIRSQIQFIRSTDCGATWSQSIKISEGHLVNQGTAIGIDPRTGDVYVVWRQFHPGVGRVPSQPHALLIAKSTDGGKSFSKPVTAYSSVLPFDQPTSPPAFGTDRAFRFNSLPTIAIDNASRVYLAWSQRGVGPGADAASGLPGDSRIVFTTSADGLAWSEPRPVDNTPQRGHQIMPAMAFASGRLAVLHYDLRDDHSSVFGPFVNDPMPSIRHTVDARVALAEPGAFPIFTSRRVTRYAFGLTSSNALEQLQFNRPNFPLFGQGILPFIGDYLDIAGAPSFLPNADGSWAHNSDPSDTPVFHATWTDNRDVHPPADGNWANYRPPVSLQPTEFPSPNNCQPGQGGMRNQNVYSSRVTGGLIVGSPWNTKPLGLIQRAFVVFAQNTTNLVKTYRMSIVNQPPGGEASFEQFSFKNSVEVTIARRSTVARTVYVRSTDPSARVTVEVREITGPSGGFVPGGLRGSVVINPDRTTPRIVNPDPGGPDIRDEEVYDPTISNPNIVNLDLFNPNIVNPNIVNPNIVNPNIVNPNIVNPNIVNPNIVNPNIVNPNIVNPNIVNSSLTDVTWSIKNTGNTSATYSFNLFSPTEPPEDLQFQLMIYRLYTTPAVSPTNCNLVQETHQELLSNILSPNIVNPNIVNSPSAATRAAHALSLPQDTSTRNNANGDPSQGTEATFFLLPGDTAQVTLRIFNPDRTRPLQFEPGAVGGAVAPEAVNTVDAEAGITTPRVVSALVVTTTSLPNGVRDAFYLRNLQAVGGEGGFVWSLESGALPPGMGLSPTGVLSGIPTAAGTFNFTVRVQDSASPPHTDTQALTLVINAVPPGTIATLAGSTWVLPGLGGPAASARIGLGFRAGATADAAGNVYIADPLSHMVFRVSAGIITAFAGTGTAGFGGDGGAATAALLNSPEAVTVDSAGNVWIADTGNGRIRRVDALGNIVSLVAGLLRPGGMVFDAAGNLYISDTNRHRVRRFNTDGTLVIVAGNGVSAYSGDGGAATSASLSFPQGLTLDAAGNLYIADSQNHRVRMVNAAGNITTAAGDGVRGFSPDGGLATASSLDRPAAVALDPLGNLLISDLGSNRVRMVNAGGIVSTMVGNGTFAYSGDGGPATSASLANQSGIALVGGTLYIADGLNKRIRSVDAAGIIRTVAGSGFYRYAGDGGPATSAFLGRPWSVVGDASGNIYFPENDNQVVRRVDSSKTISTFVGTGFLTVPAGDGGPASGASLSFPRGVALDPARGFLYVGQTFYRPQVRRVDLSTSIITTLTGPSVEANHMAVDASGNLYIASNLQNVVIRVDTSGAVTTVAGNGVAGFSGDGGPATAASLSFPTGVVVDLLNNLYIADNGNNRIRRVDAAGTISTIAGTGVAGFSGDGGPAINATFRNLWGLAMDSSGNIYVADTGNSRIRVIRTTGIVTTAAGTGLFGFSGDGGQATAAALNNPHGVWLDAAGNLYIADTFNDRIRVVAGPIP